MKIFDAHCDTVYEILNKDLELNENGLNLDRARMSEYDSYIQVFAAFVDKCELTEPPLERGLRLIDRYKREIKKCGISEILTKADLDRAQDGGVHSILSIEGGEVLQGSIAALRMFYKLGVRLITLTWNYANEIADGIEEGRGAGLTDFGRRAVAEMENLGVLVDVSHLSERGFWDVAEWARYPFVASHSCAKALCGRARNLTDEQIKAIANSGGCIGVNFYPEFLADDGISSIETIAKHAAYIINVGGEDVAALGSDFDGVECLPDGMRGVQDMARLADAFRKEGISADITDKIMFKNLYRVFGDSLSRSDKVQM